MKADRNYVLAVIQFIIYLGEDQISKKELLHYNV